jgi:hypothetical protein
MKPPRVLVSVMWVACVLATAASGWTQETTSGSLAGRVLDTQNLAVPGATVTVSSSQGSRNYVTDDSGRFYAPYLTPGTYTVRAELQGFRPVEQQKVEVRLGQRLELTLVLPVGGRQEQVQVVAAAPVIDTASTTAGARLESEVLDRLPVGRRFTDVLYVSPGVSSGGGTGNANASMAGGSGLENNYVIDGVNTSEAGYGAAGSYSVTFKTLGNGIPFDFVQEVQIKTAGFEAESGQSTGGIVNVITKSGTNDLRGSLFAYSRPQALESAWTQLSSANGTVNTTGTEGLEGGFTVGGPIAKNRLFFFGAYDPTMERTKLIAPPGFPLASLGEVNQDRRSNAYSVKASYQMSTKHRFDASFFGDPSHGPNGPQRATAMKGSDTAGFSAIDSYGANNQTGRYDGIISQGWLIEASFARSAATLKEAPSVDQWAYTDTTVIPNVVTGGIGKYESNDEGKRLQYQAKSTHILGAHQVRYGGVYEDISYTSAFGVTGPTFTVPDGRQTVTGAVYSAIPDPVFGKIYRVSSGYTNNLLPTTQKYYSWFAQDTWRAGARVTVRAGVRWDQQKFQGVGAAYTFPGGWAPRVGVTYDPSGRGRSKLYANYGRFYTQYPNDLATRGFSALSATNQADYYDLNLTQPIADGVLAGNTLHHYIISGADPAQAYPGTKNTYNNEYLVGAEYEWLPGLSLSVRYIHRDLQNVIEDMAPAAKVLYDLGLAQNIVFTIGNPQDGFPPTQNVPAVIVNGSLVTPSAQPAHEQFIRKYDAVEFYADKRLSHLWTLQASYRWSRLWGDYEGYYRNDNNQSDPGLTSLADQPINDPTYTEIGTPLFGYRGDIRYLGRLGAGPLPNDRTHQFKAFGSFGPIGGLSLGGGLQVGSGVPLTQFALSTIPMGPRGSGVQTVDGAKDRTPVQFGLDCHADYAFMLGGPRRLVLLFDVFNLFNSQTAIGYNQTYELTGHRLNPDYGTVFQTANPRQVRIGARFQF